MGKTRKSFLQMHFEWKDLIKVPNILCYIRIILVPVFCYIYINAQKAEEYRIAAVIVIVSGITDFLDGQIARRCNMITDLGKVLDPIADKLMQLAMLVCVSIRVHYMAVLVAALLVKEIVTAITGAIIVKTCNKRLNGAKWYGKVCTFVLYILMILIIMWHDMPDGLQGGAFIICLISLVVSFVMYIGIYYIMYKDTKKFGKEEFKVY